MSDDPARESKFHTESRDYCPKDDQKIRELTTIGEFHPDQYDEIRKHLSSRPNGYEAYCNANEISKLSLEDHAKNPSTPQMMFNPVHFRGDNDQILFELKVPKVERGWFDGARLSNIYKEYWNPTTGKRETIKLLDK